jgi:dihydrofolate reductase
MRKLVNSTYVTLDGVIQDPQDWPSLGSFSEPGDQIQTDLLLRCDAQIMGRKTYESFAMVWPTRGGNPFGDHINAMAKYVFSSQISDPAWENTTAVDSDPVAFVADLKQRDGGDIIHYGFGHLAHALMNAGLLDELRLWVHPFFVGTGNADDLIYQTGSTGTFTHADTITLGSGIIILIYHTKAA